MVIALVFILTSYSISIADQVSDEKAKARSLIAESEVMELRLFLYKGKIVWVEPIEPPQHPKVKGEYTVEIVKNLKEERIREVSPVAFQQESPGCSYWYVYETRDGIVKICLRR